MEVFLELEQYRYSELSTTSIKEEHINVIHWNENDKRPKCAFELSILT